MNAPLKASPSKASPPMNSPSSVKKQQQVHAGFVALVGPANAGKSSLFNAFIGYKVAATSSKVQVTRRIHLGIYNGIHKGRRGQLVFMDTPGFMEEIKRKKTELENFMAEQSFKALQDADIILLVVSPDLKNIEEQIPPLIEMIRRQGGLRSSQKMLGILNKKDLKQKHPETFQALENLFEKEGLKFHALSKLKKDTALKKDFLSYLLSQTPLQRAPFYDEDLYTPHSLRYICSEIIYQNCFRYLHQELPYQLAVRIQTCRQQGATFHLLGELITGKENHKSIIIGQKGKTLKGISQAAREQLEKVLKKPVFIRLQVRHQSNWTKNKKSIKAILS